MEDKKRELRKFGITFAIVFAVWGSLCMLHRRSFSHYFFVFSGIFLIVSFTYPHALKPFQKISTGILLFISRIIKFIVLNILFFLVLTPCGILARLFGNKYLDLKFRDGRDSYWNKRPHLEIDKKRYEDQF